VLLLLLLLLLLLRIMWEMSRYVTAGSWRSTWKPAAADGLV
jgi:hypothetical protein